MTVYRGLSLHQPYAGLVAAGLKTIETRRHRIHYRGDLVICASRTFDEAAWVRIRSTPGGCGPLGEIMRLYDAPTGDALPRGVALALVTVTGCRLLEPEDEAKAFIFGGKLWVWELSNVRPLKRLSVRGMNGMFPIPDDRVVFDA